MEGETKSLFCQYYELISTSHVKFLLWILSNIVLLFSSLSLKFRVRQASIQIVNFCFAMSSHYLFLRVVGQVITIYVRLTLAENFLSY